MAKEKLSKKLEVFVDQKIYDLLKDISDNRKESISEWVRHAIIVKLKRLPLEEAKVLFVD